MYLCFGTLGTLLVHGKIDQITNKTPFIAKLILTIDPKSIYANKSSDTDDTYGNYFGNESGISRLLSCSNPFVAFAKNQVEITSLDEIKKNIFSIFLPFVDEDKKAGIVCSLLEIIRNDDTLKNENKYFFKSIFGANSETFLLQTEYDFCDLIAKALLYTTNVKIDNKLGTEYVKCIDDNWIKINRSYYLDKFEWDDSTQCLTFSLLSYFNKMIRSYKIDVFIEKVDPTGVFGYSWIEECDAFISKVSNTLSTYSSSFYESNNSKIDNIFKFLDKLEEYINYIGLNVLPLLPAPQYDSLPKIPDPSTKEKIIDDSKNDNLLVPRHRDENVKWELAFASETQKYRKELFSIYSSIYSVITPIRSHKST